MRWRLRGRRSENDAMHSPLTNACNPLARAACHHRGILHTTQALNIAWGLHQGLGFTRPAGLDFSQQGLPVSGFRLQLQPG